MGKLRTFAVYGSAVIIIFGLLLVHDFKKPDCVEAQTCTPFPGNEFTWQTFTDFGNRGNNTSSILQCWGYCAVTGLYGIDDDGDEGFRIQRGGSCGQGRYNWTFYVGKRVDRAYVTCMNIN